MSWLISGFVIGLGCGLAFRGITVRHESDKPPKGEPVKAFVPGSPEHLAMLSRRDEK